MNLFLESLENCFIGTPIVLVASHGVLNESKLGIAVKTGVPLAAFGLGAYAYHNKDNIESAVNDILPTPEEKERMIADLNFKAEQQKLEALGSYQQAKNTAFNSFGRLSPEQEKNYSDLEMARMSKLMFGGK